MTRKIELAAGERSLVQITMPPSSHPVEVRSSPSGARVFLDRKPVDGLTPVTVQVVDDDLHELRVEKLGFETAEYTLAPDDRQPAKSFDLVPETRPRGRLAVDANANAEVWIDGADTGFSTPTLSMPVTVGAHRVELRGDDGSTVTRAINVRRGETIRLMLTLTAPPPQRRVDDRQDDALPVRCFAGGRRARARPGEGAACAWPRWRPKARRGRKSSRGSPTK